MRRTAVCVLFYGCFCQALAEFVDLKVEHALGGDAFRPAGRLYGYIDDDTGSNKILTLDREALGEAERADIARLVEEDGLYKVRIPAGSGLDSELQTSLKARCLAKAGLQDMLLLHATLTGKLVGMNYDMAALQCGAAAAKVPLDGPWDFQSSSKVPVWAPLPAPPIRLSGSAKPPGMEFPDASQKKQPGSSKSAKDLPKDAPAKDERPWLLKNWMIVLPVGLLVMNVVGQLMGGGQEAPAGNAAAVAAPRPAASGGGRNRR